MNLNNIQKKAVNFVLGPCLVIAGAGSGKTSVIVYKIFELIRKYKYDPKNIIAITFTNKAVNEIRIRLSQKLTSLEISNISIFTFHAFGYHIIQKEYREIGFKRYFTILNENEQIKIIKNIIYTKKLQKKYDKILLQEIVKKINLWKSKLLSPILVKNFLKNDIDKQFLEYYIKYDSFLKKRNILDFQDLIFIPTLLLKLNINIRQKWSDQFKYLLVDEYQDTNSSQYEFIKILVSKNLNFTYVGDDYQSIYSWRGAKPNIFFDLKKDYPNLKIIKLERNYRSSKRILSVANSLISHNTTFLNKNLFSLQEYGEKIHILNAENDYFEAKKIIKILQKHKKNFSLNYSDYAILYRNNYQAKILEVELLYNNIQYHIHGGSCFFEGSEIKDIIAYLKLIINPDDDLAFSRIVNRPNRKIGKLTLNKLQKWANKKKCSLFYASLHPFICKILKVKTVLVLKNFSLWIKNVIKNFDSIHVNIIQVILEYINYINWIKKKKIDKNLLKNKLNNIIFFSCWFQKIWKKYNEKSIETLHKIVFQLTCCDFENYSPETFKKKNKINLMTLHASKGLEFPVVFIIGLEEGILPHKKCFLSKNIEEERRLMYVGITRAQKKLYLSFCKIRKNFGVLKKSKPSRFLLELSNHDVLWEDDITNSNFSKKSNNFLQYIKLRKIFTLYTK